MNTLPEHQALQCLAELPPGARVVVDFDETLLLANSTLLFIDSVRPRWLAWTVFKLVSLVFRLLPGALHAWRDAAVLVSLCLVCPWALPVWRRRAPRTAQAHANQPLARALVAHCRPEQVVVCSFGLGFVIRPLLAPLWHAVGAQADWAAVPLVASTARSAGTDRRAGKASLLAASGLVVPGEPLAVVTDSLDDRDLLARATHPLFVQWAATRHGVRVSLGDSPATHKGTGPPFTDSHGTPGIHAASYKGLTPLATYTWPLRARNASPRRKLRTMLKRFDPQRHTQNT